MFSTTTIIVLIVVVAHFVIGIGLLVYKITSAAKEAELKEQAEKEAKNKDDTDESKVIED